MKNKIALSLLTFSCMLYGIDWNDSRIKIYDVNNYTNASGSFIINNLILKDESLMNLLNFKQNSTVIKNEFYFDENSDSFLKSDYDIINGNYILTPVASILEGYTEVYYPLYQAYPTNNIEYLKSKVIAINNSKVSFNGANLKPLLAFDNYSLSTDNITRTSIKAKEINISNSTLEGFWFSNMYNKFMQDSQRHLINTHFGDYKSGVINVVNSTLINTAVKTGTLNISNSTIQANGIFANKLNSTNTTYVFNDSNKTHFLYVRAEATGERNIIKIDKDPLDNFASVVVIQDTANRINEDYFKIEGKQTALTDYTPAYAYLHSPSKKAIWFITNSEENLKQFDGKNDVDIDAGGFLSVCDNHQGCMYDGINYILDDSHPLYNVYKANGVINEEGIYIGDINDIHVKPAKSVLSQVALKHSTSILNQAKFSWAFEVNNLTKRLGDIRNLDGTNGIWARAFMGSGSYSEQKVDFYAIQTGVDEWLNDGNSLLGISLGYTKQNLKNAVTGNQTSYSLGAYYTRFLNDNLYLDAVLKYIKSSGKYSYERFGGKLDSNKLGIWLGSLELGYKLPISSMIYIEPQAELIISRIPKSEISNNLVSFKMDSSMPINAKVAMYGGLDISEILTFRTGLGGYFDLNGAKTNVYLAEENKTYKEKIKNDKRIFANIFGAYKINEKSKINLELEKTFGGDFNIDYNINLNYRYVF